MWELIWATGREGGIVVVLRVGDVWESFYDSPPNVS